MRNIASADSAAQARVRRPARGWLATKPGTGCPADSSSLFIMRFDQLAPVSRPLAPADNAVRGIAGNQLPWSIGAGAGSLSPDGHLLVRIRGLILASHPLVPASLRNTNPFPAFRIVVSCLGIGPADTATIVNVSTGDFEATASGDCDIDARLNVPQPCRAPIVLVIGPTGTANWLAAAAASY
jgi:hypothetical protein